MKGKRIFCIVALCILIPLFIFILCLPKCVKPNTTASAVLVDNNEGYSNAFYGSTLTIYDMYFLTDIENQSLFTEYPHNFYYNNLSYPLGNDFNAFFTNPYNLDYYSLYSIPLNIPKYAEYEFNDFEIKSRNAFYPITASTMPFCSFSWVNYPLGYEQFQMLSNVAFGHNNAEMADQRYIISVQLNSVDTGTLIGYYKTSQWTVYDRLNHVFNNNTLNELYAEYPSTEDKMSAFELVNITVNVYRYANSLRDNVTFTSPIVSSDRVELWKERSFAWNNIVTVEPSPLEIIFGGIDNFFAIELFPNFNVGLIFEICMAVLIIGIGLKVFLGG